MKKIIFLWLISVSVKAQYVAEAPLGKVEKDGFYEIPLPPNVNALITVDWSNLRILDGQDAEVPYIPRSERAEYSNIGWNQFRMEKDVRKGCCTVVTLFNDQKKSINNFLLEIRNASIMKAAVLRGSDDQKTWYALRENFPLSFGELNNKTVTEVFDFPLSDYKFYQLTINDSTTSPLNIVSAWLTSENITKGIYVEVPSVSISSSDSLNGRFTWATIHSDTSQYVNKLEFDVEGPRFYKRRVTLFQRVEYMYRKKRIRTMNELYSFDLISGRLPMIHVYAKEKDIFLRVDNENNQPLKFTDVRAYQLKQSLVAWLEAGRDYKIAIGSDSLEAPVYDLEFFRDSIPAHPSRIEIGSLKQRPAIKPQEPSPTYFKDKRLIWGAIILVAIVLLGMSVRMLRDKDLKKDQ